MSEEIGQIESKRGDDIFITSFWGGVTYGPCLQLTASNGTYIQIPKDQAVRLSEIIKKWAETP